MATLENGIIHPGDIIDDTGHYKLGTQQYQNVYYDPKAKAAYLNVTLRPYELFGGPGTRAHPASGPRAAVGPEGSRRRSTRIDVPAPAPASVSGED